MKPRWYSRSLDIRLTKRAVESPPSKSLPVTFHATSLQQSAVSFHSEVHRKVSSSQLTSPSVSFPAQSDLKKSRTPAKSKIFNVSPKLWDVYDHGDNNCTSIVGGTNALNYKGATAWLLGQPFFAGHYIDFDISAHTISYADLKDPSMESST